MVVDPPTHIMRMVFGSLLIEYVLLAYCTCPPRLEDFVLSLYPNFSSSSYALPKAGLELFWLCVEGAGAGINPWKMNHEYTSATRSELMIVIKTKIVILATVFECIVVQIVRIRKDWLLPGVGI